MNKDKDHGVRPCCIPDCGRSVPRNRAQPYCSDCGLAIAEEHFIDASLRDPLMRKAQADREARRAKLREGETDTAVVYYVRLDEARIKIGFTSNLRPRIAGLRVDSSALMACEPGGKALERVRHDQFRALRINRREEFAPAPELLEWIEIVKREFGVPYWATLPDTQTVTRRMA